MKGAWEKADLMSKEIKGSNFIIFNKVSVPCFTSDVLILWYQIVYRIRHLSHKRALLGNPPGLQIHRTSASCQQALFLIHHCHLHQEQFSRKPNQPYPWQAVSRIIFMIWMVTMVLVPVVTWGLMVVLVIVYLMTWKTLSCIYHLLKARILHFFKKVEVIMLIK